MLPSSLSPSRISSPHQQAKREGEGGLAGAGVDDCNLSSNRRLLPYRLPPPASCPADKCVVGQCVRSLFSMEIAHQPNSLRCSAEAIQLPCHLSRTKYPAFSQYVFVTLSLSLSLSLSPVDVPIPNPAPSCHASSPRSCAPNQESRTVRRPFIPSSLPSFDFVRSLKETPPLPPQPPLHHFLSSCLPPVLPCILQSAFATY